LNILIITPYFYPAEAFGGPVKLSYEVGKELAQRGHKVVVFTSDAKDFSDRVGQQTIDLGGMCVFYLRNLSLIPAHFSNLFITPNLSSLLDKKIKTFDIIHSHEYTTYQNIVLHKYAKKYDIPYIIQAHGSLPRVGRTFRKKIYDLLFGKSLLVDASKVIALNEMETLSYRTFGIPADKIALVPNGLNLSSYRNLPPRGCFKKKHKIPNHNKIILYLGRLHESKGIDLLIDSFSYLTKELELSNCVLVIAGPDDGYLDKAKHKVTLLGISNLVVFTGFVSDHTKRCALTDADVFVTPAFYGFPMTFLEACAVGLPIVTTTLGDRLDWIDAKVGMVVAPKKEDLSNAIYRILSDKKYREYLSMNCLHKIEEFSIEKFARQLESIYISVIDKKNPN
jgi:glycosyltransferase involved in cell wall biosynthesis